MCCNSIIGSYFDFAQYDKVLNDLSSSPLSGGTATIEE